MKRHASLLILLSFLAASFAVAQSPSIDELKTKAESGDLKSQLALAAVYNRGEGVAKNEELAFKWYRAAADQGNPEAQTQVGIMYRYGIGVDQDKSASVKWYMKAAAAGNADARYNLAVAYYNGDGIDINDERAYSWFVLAKEAGSEQAAEAVKRTESEHQKIWIDRSKLFLAQAVEKGLGVKADPTWAAVRYREIAADKDASSQIRAEAGVRLARMLIEGRGVSQSLPGARTHCEAAAKEGSREGMACMGDLSYGGAGGAPDYKGALRWYREAARLGDRASMFMLGRMSEGGEGVKKDAIDACVWYWLAGDYGKPTGKQEAARVYDSMDAKEQTKVKERLHLVDISAKQKQAIP